MRYGSRRIRLRDRGWYGLVSQVGAYLLVFFLLDSDITPGSTRGYIVYFLLFRMSYGLTEIEYKLHNPPGRFVS